MEKTDAKVRLFLELSHQHPIQILNYLPLKPFDEWNPERMYEHPKDQYYYAFINDNELIYRIKNLFDKNYEDIQDISNQIDIIKSDLKMSKISIEFNGCNIETFDDLESNKLKIPLINNNNEDINNINVINNQEEERYAVFIRFFLNNFGFIHNYDKLNKDELNKLLEKPIIYALKGSIKSLINIRKKDLDLKRGENDITNVVSNEEDKSHIGADIQNKKDLEDKNNGSNKGIDGHWFLINTYENVDFLSLIKYKEKLVIQTEIDKGSSNTLLSNNVSNISASNQLANSKYSNPHIFSYIIKDTKKFVTVYQNKSCKYHHNKNEFICKDCSDFCCLECFEEKSKNNFHFGHKITLLDEVMNKFAEDTEFMDERVQYLKGIIENEITDKKAEILAIKGKNETTVNDINSENDNIRKIIKKEQINRAKVLGFLGNEALRILNDFNLKLRYIKILNDKGDMSTYLTNYFYFVKYYRKEILKNLLVLEKKILATEEKFNEYNNKLINVIEELRKNL
jgi:hypothetical protein